MKKTIILMIITGIICGSIGVVAGSYNAKQISFTPSDTTWNVKTVSEAINDLKTNKFKNNYSAEFRLSALEHEPGKVSYIDFDIADYNNMKINITHHINDSNNQCYLLIDGEDVSHFNGEGEYSFNITNNSKARIVYTEYVGWNYCSGTYELTR